jgi:hypothetical protein
LFSALTERLERDVALDMVSALYAAVGVKAGGDADGQVMAVLDMFESDALGAASDLWQPLNVTPAVLALACRKLITTTIYPPKPAELYAACREVRCKITWAVETCEDVVDTIVEADALLLRHARDEWRQPYETELFRPVLRRMLELHNITCLDESDPFAKAIDEEQARLLLPPPEPKLKQKKRKTRLEAAE